MTYPLTMHRRPMHTPIVREPTYFVLVSLMAGPMHGYGIAKRAEELSGGRVRLTAGTLYGALERLTHEGLITLDRSEVVGGRTRRYYRITDAGRHATLAEIERMRTALDAAVATGVGGAWQGAS